MVPRWRAWTTTAAAGVAGWSAGTWGIGDTAAALAWTLVAGALAAGLTRELCRQARSTDFDDIERRHREARALDRGPGC